MWSAFADSNYAVSLRNVQYQGRVWQIPNNLFPFLLEEVRQWPCGHGDIAAQLASANEDRFLAKWLNSSLTGLTRLTGLDGAGGSRLSRPNDDGRDKRVPPNNPVNPVKNKLSSEAQAVMSAARALYRDFYANITHTPWMDWKIETWDVGYYQIRNAMKNVELRNCGNVETANNQCGMNSTLPINNLSLPQLHSSTISQLRAAHDALRAKLLPQIYSLGFLNPDVEYFK